MSASKIVLHNLDISPPCRAVSIVAYLIDLDIVKRDIDYSSGEHLTDWFLKLNPQHTVPTLEDNDNVVWDSHAICTYLVDKYGKTDALYPKDVYLRARCNQFLFFDATGLFPRLRAASYAIFHEQATTVSQDKIDAMHAAYAFLETMLKSSDFLVGDTMTVADICAYCTVDSLDVLYAPILSAKYPKIFGWLQRLKSHAFYVAVEKNGKYVAQYKQTIGQLLEANKKSTQ